MESNRRERDEVTTVVSNMERILLYSRLIAAASSIITRV